MRHYKFCLGIKLYRRDLNSALGEIREMWSLVTETTKCGVNCI